MNKFVKNFVKTFGVLTVLTFAASVLYAKKSKNDAKKSRDGKFYYYTPLGWESIPGELNPDAVIELGDKINNAYLVAIPYNKKSFAALEEFYTYFVGQMELIYQDYQLIHTQQVSVNNKDAYLIQGTLMFDDILYESRVYTIEYADVYLFVMAWTPEDDAEFLFPEIESIISSLKNV